MGDTEEEDREGGGCFHGVASFVSRLIHVLDPGGADRLGDVGVAISFKKFDEAMGDLFHDTRAAVDERGIKLQESGTKANFLVGVRGGEDATGTDDQLLTAAIDALVKAGDATVDMMLDGAACYGTRLMSKSFSRCGEP